MRLQLDSQRTVVRSVPYDPDQPAEVSLTASYEVLTGTPKPVVEHLDVLVIGAAGEILEADILFGRGSN
ncbi:putative tail fiber component J [Salmonella phage 21]|nr:putative tail fiber component J [Salmonella phage 21]